MKLTAEQLIGSLDASRSSAARHQAARESDSMRRITGLAIALLVLAACDSQIAKTFGDLLDIRNSVAAIVDADNVAVNVHNGAALSVVITNSSLNSESSEAREIVADQVARLAYHEYSNHDGLEFVHVAFVSYQRKFIVTINSTIESFQYSASALRVSPASG